MNYEFFAKLSKESNLTHFLKSIGLTQEAMSQLELMVGIRSDVYFLEKMTMPDWLRFTAALDISWEITDYFIVKKIAA